MSTPEEVWNTRLHAAVDDHPGAWAFDVPSYVAAGRTRARRRRVATLCATAAVVAAMVAAAAMVGTRGAAPQPAPPTFPIPGPGARGWVAFDADQGEDRGGAIYLVRPGEDARRLEVAASSTTDDACPAWSPDGTRLLFGRLLGAPNTSSRDAELVIVPVDGDGAAGSPTEIGLDGFDVLPGFEPHPCGIWSPDGRWVAFAGGGEVWVVDTQAREIRRLPDQSPIDLEWRPGTDELALTGDMGSMRSSDRHSTPVTLYSVSTGKSRQLGSVDAAYLTWSPDGSTLAYAGVGLDELRLVDADGSNDGSLLADMGDPANHGLGPVWSPLGDRILYQRRVGCCELSEVVLVSTVDGTTKVLENPKRSDPDGHPDDPGSTWWPYTVTWSPDGTTLLYTAWSWFANGSGEFNAVIAVPADTSTNATLLTDLASVGGYHSHPWARIQMWARQPR
jgi:Tol biopolymer transport system component